MKDTITFPFFDESQTVRITKGEYELCGLALQAWCYTKDDDDDKGYWEEWNDLTVFLTPTFGPYAYVNASENAALLEELVRAGYAKPTGRIGNSGFATYPFCEFDDNWLDGLMTTSEFLDSIE